MTKFEKIDNAELHDQMEDIPTNRSGNTPFTAIAERRMARRSVVKGSVAAAAAGFFAPSALAKGVGKANGKGKAVTPGSLVNFEPVSVDQGSSDSAVPHISPDYEYQVLVPWGTDLDNPDNDYEGDPSTRPTAAEQANMVGIGHDGMWLFPEDIRHQKFVKNGYKLSNKRGLLCVNHEFGRNPHVTDKAFPESLEDVRLSQHAHGVSVLDIRRKMGSDEWELVRGSYYNRRIHVNTEVDFSGPVAGSALLMNSAGNTPKGTVNNCGSGPTPWGTYVTCEENFNGYFGRTGEDANGRSTLAAEGLDRYGFTDSGFGYGWHVFDERFDLSSDDHINECNRFGWCVEIDPFDPEAKPIKRSALGRFKHEAIAIKEIYGNRIAAYMGDDQRFDYCYKYESNLPWKSYIARGESPLDDGKLYVARFDADGTGEWMELTIENPALSAKFSSQEEVLTYARIAADILGATPMDRPEWTTIGTEGQVYWTLTNNSQRTVADAANPEAPNNDGHIIRTDDIDSTAFKWDVFILASTTRGTDGVFTDPDAAWADNEGRLFIGTDGGQPDGLQDQLVVFDTTAEGEPVAKRLFVGVASDEITGYATTPDYAYAFINMQHPGNGDPTATNFPAPADSGRIPRDCTIVIKRKDGGKVGS